MLSTLVQKLSKDHLSPPLLSNQNLLKKCLPNLAAAAFDGSRSTDLKNPTIAKPRHQIWNERPRLWTQNYPWFFYNCSKKCSNWPMQLWLWRIWQVEDCIIENMGSSPRVGGVGRGWDKKGQKRDGGRTLITVTPDRAAISQHCCCQGCFQEMVSACIWIVYSLHIQFKYKDKKQVYI